MAIAIVHDQEPLVAGEAHSVLRDADADAVGLILQNRGTGFVYYTLNGTAPSKTNGLRLAPNQIKFLLGAEWADPSSGESFVQGEVRGVYFGGSDAGGADPDEAVINIVNITNA